MSYRGYLLPWYSWHFRVICFPFVNSGDEHLNSFTCLDCSLLTDYSLNIRFITVWEE